MYVVLQEALLNCLGDEELQASCPRLQPATTSQAFCLQVRKVALHSVNVVCVSPTCSEVLQDSTEWNITFNEDA